MKGKKFNLIVIAISLVFLLVYVFAIDGIAGFSQAISAAKPLWLCAAVIPMLIYWLLEAQILHLAVKRFYRKQSFGRTLQTSMIGQLFNCITPFASGGQPIQAYHMTQGGVPLGSAACALTVKFIVYQFVLTIYSFITLLFHFRAFSAKIENLKYLVLLGFSLNAAVILGLLGICFWREGTKRFLERCIALGHRLRLVRHPEKACAALEEQIELFYTGFTALRGAGWMLLKMALLSVLQLTAYFAIPYFLLRCFPDASGSFFSMLAAQAFVLNVSSFVPLPGAAGGAELSFHTMFALFFPAQYLPLSILLWRVITFYLPILVGAAFTWEGRAKKRDLPDSAPDGKIFPA